MPAARHKQPRPGGRDYRRDRETIENRPTTAR
jgi:hypothetical protein